MRIDPKTGKATEIGLGSAKVVNGDGLLLVGRRTLYVVQNRLERIAVIRFRRISTGSVQELIESGDFDVPTTVARFGRRLYLPNARFTTPLAPDTNFRITRVRR